MKSITIHNIDDRVSALIEKKAREDGKSLNKTIKELLRYALGIKPSRDKSNRDEFADLFGVWDENDFNLFQENVRDLDQINPDDWK